MCILKTLYYINLPFLHLCVLGKHKWGKEASLYLHSPEHTHLSAYTQSHNTSQTVLCLPQALYKLYSVAANHRQLYNHAFPGHQSDQQPEQDKKRNWPNTACGQRQWSVRTVKETRDSSPSGHIHTTQKHHPAPTAQARSHMMRELRPRRESANNQADLQ